MKNTIDNLLNTEIHRQRQMGYTTGIVYLAKNLHGTVLCHSESEAKRLRSEYGVKAESAQKDLRGSQGPFFWDSGALLAAHSEVQNELSKKDAEILDLKNQIRAFETKEVELEKAIDQIVEILGIRKDYY